LFNLLCQKGKDEEHLDHDLYDYIRHFLGRGEIYVGLKPSEHILYPFEDVQECVLVSAYALNRLGVWASNMCIKDGEADTHREKTTNAREYHSHRWVCLESRCYGAILSYDFDHAYQANSVANRR